MGTVPKKNLKSALLFLLIIVGGMFTFNSFYEGTFMQFLQTSVLTQDVLSATNEQRTENQKNTLHINALLTEAAQAKADDMAAKGYFSHVSPDGKKFTSWIQESGYDYLYVGENLAVKFTSLSSLINAWMNSELHRKNILDDNFSETGIGIAEGEYKGKKATFYVQFFGQPKISQEEKEKYNLKPSASEVVGSLVLRFLPLY